MNEMGAAWVLKKDFYSILVKGFNYEEMDGVINDRKISVKVDAEDAKARLNELKDRLVSLFNSQGVDETRWENLRDEFLTEVNSYPVNDINKDLLVLDPNRKAMGSSTAEATFKSAFLPYFTQLFDMLDMENYPKWTYNLAVSGITRIKSDRYYKIQNIINYSSRCANIKGFESFQILTFSFRDVLNDLINVFCLHSRLIGDDIYDFHKFYKDHLYDEERNSREEKEYEEESLLIADLTFEMTRVLNLLLERIREYEPGFMAEYGTMTIVDATDIHGNPNTPIVFKDTEKGDSPYPGLLAFLEERCNRTHHLSEGKYLEHALRREGVIK